MEISDDYLFIYTSAVNTIGIPLWFAGLVLVAVVSLVAVVVVALLAAMSNKRREKP